MQACLLVIFYTAITTTQEQNCTENELRNQTSSWHEYVIDNALSQVDSNERDFESMKDDLQRILDENTLYDTCISQDDATDLINTRLEEMKDDLQRMFYLTCIITSVSMIFSIAGISLGLAMHHKLGKMQKGHQAFRERFDGKQQACNEYALPVISTSQQDCAGSRVDLMANSL